MNNLRTLRKQAGMTVASLADAMSASPVTITAWENGTRTMKPERAKLALEVLANNGVYATLDALYATRPADQQKAA